VEKILYIEGHGNHDRAQCSKACTQFSWCNKRPQHLWSEAPLLCRKYDGNVLVFTVGVVIPGSGGGTDGYGGDSLLAATGTELTGTLTASGLALLVLGGIMIARQRVAASSRQ
jgi:hypothetical protein